MLISAYKKIQKYFSSAGISPDGGIDGEAYNIIDKEIRSYFTSETSNRALVFSAPWGSGKSTLIKSWIKENTSKSKIKQRNGSKFEPVTYVSAFGAKDGAELLVRIYAEIVSAQSLGYRLTHITGRNLFQIVGLSPNAAAQALLKVAVKPRYVIIDDLERIEEEGIKSIFGAINAITEQMNVKTVIVCDIEKLTAERHGAYVEKIIEEVIKLEINQSVAVRSIFESECSKLPRQYVETDMFAGAILDSGTQNLRHVEKAAQNYRRFIETIKDLELSSFNKFGFLTYGLTAYNIENQNGLISSDVLKCINSYLMASDQNENIKFLVEKYSKFNITQTHQAPLTPSLIVNVVVNNCANSMAIKEEIMNAYHYRNEVVEEWQVVWHLSSSARSEIDRAIKEQREKITSRSYLDTGIILHVFSNELRLAQIGASGKDYTLIVDEAKKYIDDVKKIPELRIHYENDSSLYELIDISSYKGLGYPASDPELRRYFIDIWDYMKDSIKENRQQNLMEHINFLFIDIQENLDEISEILTDRHNQKFEDQFLQNLDYRDVARQIATMDAPFRRKICMSLSGRVYQRAHDRQDEIDWLRMLGQELFTLASDRDAIDKNSITIYAEHSFGYKPESQDSNSG